MGRNIKVTPEEMRVAAASIDGMIQNYKANYLNICNRVDNLKQSWKGKDNVAFTQKIGEFKSDFVKLENLLNDYTKFLRTSAQTYEENQQAVYDRARSLENSIK